MFRYLHISYLWVEYKISSRVIRESLFCELMHDQPPADLPYFSEYILPAPRKSNREQLIRGLFLSLKYSMHKKKMQGYTKYSVAKVQKQSLQHLYTNRSF